MSNNNTYSNCPFHEIDKLRLNNVVNCLCIFQNNRKPFTKGTS